MSLKKILKNAKQSINELNTTLIEIEGTISNRPLPYAYDEADELTPAHLMYGFDMIPDEFKDEEDETSIQKRHRYLANRRRRFLNRRKREYLVNLREYHRMQVKHGKNKVQEGKVVLVKDESKLPRGRWRLGHIVQIIYGSDGIARGAKIDVIGRSGRRVQIDRPLQKLVPLEVNALVENNKEDLDSSLKQTRRHAAKTDADWRRKLMDQMLDQLD